MKKILVALLALASWAGVSNAKPRNVDSSTISFNVGLSGFINGSSPTFALNMVTPTVSSSAVDLSATVGLYVQITGTAATQPAISVQFSNVSTSGFLEAFQLSNGCWAIQPIGRYVKFQSVATTGTTQTAKTSCNYYILTP